MTAWGFVLYIMGLLWCRVIDNSATILDWRDTGAALELVGLILLVLGIAQFLWEHMP